MPYRIEDFALAATLVCACPAANAAVTISSAATQNMSCASGVCTPTAANAVLNVNDLESMLASGVLTVNTGGALASDIDLDAAIAWASANGLTLDAYRSIGVASPVADNGAGGLTILTNDGGSGGIFSFTSAGSISFLGTSNTLSVNGVTYALENNVAALASAIAANPAGSYALANNYDASHDGTYRSAAIPTAFSGAFEGLGNTISNLSLKGTGNGDSYVGLFAELGANGQPGGTIENIVLKNVGIDGNGFVNGGLVGLNIGTVSGAFASGVANSTFHHDGPEIGLLVGANYGTITRFGATGTVTGSGSAGAGGLAGVSAGVIAQSYADCVVSGNAGKENSGAGGLTGSNGGAISDSYALGKAKGWEEGGLVGANSEESTIARSYSTTAVNKKGGPEEGGLIGVDYSPAGSNTSDYWDTTTSKVGKNHGAGNVKDDPGIFPVTTSQLQSGLPQGFDPTIWAQSPSINGGLPYLINNPPR
jgi:hypothetical protein